MFKKACSSKGPQTFQGVKDSMDVTDASLTISTGHVINYRPHTFGMGRESPTTMVKPHRTSLSKPNQLDNSQKSTKLWKVQ